jgi:enoyl-CoA hydratase/carnithine racemase
VTDLIVPQTLVALEIREGVGVVTVDNPPVNSLTNEALASLEDVALRIAEAPDVRAVVVTGAGTKAFIAGADLEEFRAALGSDDWIEKHAALSRRVFHAWERLAQPVVAAVQASAVGGGAEFALLCDIVVADPRARFGFPEVTLGLMPGAGGTQRLPRRVPAAAARELLLLGSFIDAERAAELGLVSRVAEADEAFSEACEIATRLAALPARAVQAIKQAIIFGRDDLSAGLDRERQLFLELFESEDVREGVSAFVEKRSPMFRHR